MRPERLEFCGINSFSEKAVIDFARLLEGGIFGIFGDTGSGKTTILDAMIFALYGRIDRNRGGNAGEIIHYNCDRAYSEFDFTCEWEGRRRLFRVRREIRRKNSQQNLELCEIDGNAVHPISEGVKKTNEKILEIVGLSFEDFKKCIALPQGEFAQFVKADRGERLKLIARLFDLDRYGDKLNNALRDRFDGVKLSLAEKEGRLNEYAEYTEEALRALEDDRARLSRQKELLDRQYEEERAAFEKYTEEYERGRKLRMQRALLDERLARRGETEKKRAAVKKLPAAASAAALQKKADRAGQEHALCERSAERAAKAYADHSEKLRAETEAFQAAGYERELAELHAGRALLETADADLRELAACKKERDALAKEYREAAAECAAAEEEGKKTAAALAERRRRAAEGGMREPEEYLRGNLESALLRSEFAAEQKYFSEKLSLLRQNYPHEGALYFDAERELTARENHFRILAESEKFSDAGALLENFRALQAEQTAVREDIHRLELAEEKLSARLHDAQARLRRAADEGTKCKQKIDGLTEKLARVLNGAQDATAYAKALSAREEALRRGRDASLAAQEAMRRSIGDAQIALARAEEKGLSLQKEREEALSALGALLAENAFADIEDARALLEAYPDAEATAKEIEAYENDVRAIEGAIAALTEEGEPAAVTAQEYAEKENAFRALSAQKESVGREYAVFCSHLDRFAEKWKAKQALLKEYAAVQKEFDLLEKLRKLFYGNAFMEFVAGEYLAEISSAATETLLRLTNGRYFIRYEQGFFVGDNFNGGQLRSVNTLSGGETFLVSLSLALSLSAAIYAKSLRPIEFFFLDEGFGTLDEKLVDTVMDSLEKLKNTHFSIGLISHVEELKYRIGNKITVIPAPEGGSSKIKISS